MKRINKCYKFSLVLVLLTFVYIILCAFMQDGDKLNSIMIVIGTIISFLIFKGIYKLISKRVRSNRDTLAIILCTIFFVLMFLVCNSVEFILSADLERVAENAFALLSGHDLTEYMSVYPNNLGILYIVYFILKFATTLGVNYLKLGYLLNSLAISISAYFTYLSIKRLAGKKVALFFLIFYITNPLFYLTAGYFYTRTFVMPFISLLLYLIIINKDSKSMGKKEIICLILIGFVSYLAYKIRAVGIFVLIAYLLVILVKDKIKIKAFKYSFITVGFLISLSLVTALSNSLNIELDEEQKFPVTQWVMIGLSQSETASWIGSWNLEDHKLITSLDTYDEKVEKTIEVINERISDMSFVELLKFAGEKLIVNWGNSGYSYTNFYLVKSVTPIYEYLAGNKNIIILYMTHIHKLVLYIFVIMSLAVELLKKKVNYSISIITIIETLVFYLFWEVNPVYSMCFIPVLLVFSAVNYKEYTKFKLNNLDFKINNKVFNVPVKKIIKWSKVLIILISSIVLIYYYGKYAGDTQVFYDKVLNVLYDDTSFGATNIRYLNSENDLVQSFNAKSKFNRITISLRENDEIEGNVYVKLLNEDMEVLTTKTIKLEDALTSDNAYIDENIRVSVNLGKTYGEGAYYIKLEANTSETVGVYALYSEDFDFYDEGTLFESDFDTENDLQFSLTYMHVSTYFKRLVYIIISITLIILEIYLLYFDIIKKKLKEKK